MQGGYHGAEPSVSLTAFVLSALQESQKICKNYVKVSNPVLIAVRGRGLSVPIGEGCLNGGVASHRMGVVMAQKGGVVIQIDVGGGRNCEGSGRG